MQLNPRYDDVPAIDIRVDVAAVRGPFLSQRRRLVDLAQSLTDNQLATPSRCAGWSVANVLTHLIDVDRFWAMSAAAGVAGTPTRVLASFDPEATPKALVEASSGLTPAEVCRNLADATTALCDGIEAFAYAAGLSPAFAVNADDTRSGRLAVVGTDPDVTLLVDVADRTATVSALGSPAEVPAGVPIIEGRSAELADALSQRAPLAHSLDPDQQWMLDGLAEVFRATS